MLEYLIGLLGDFNNFTYIWSSLSVIYIIYAILIRRKNKGVGNAICSLMGILLVVGRLKIDPPMRRLILILIECIIIIVAHIVLMKLKNGQIKNIKTND